VAVERAHAQDRPTSTPREPEFCEGMKFLVDNSGILHLDIKPENVLFDESGHVKITDFGLARVYIDRGSKKRGLRFLPSWAAPIVRDSHVISGTLPYMAPEQLAGTAELDTRADVYAFGVMLYEMLAGRRPFEARDAKGFKAAIARGSIPALPDEVPTGLRDLVLSCLNSNPRKRYQGFTVVLSRLATLCEEQAVVVQIPGGGPSRDGESALSSHDWNNRGYSFAQAGNYEEALRCYRRGLSVLAGEPRRDYIMVAPGADKKLNSSDAMCAVLQTNLGALLMRMGRVEEAKAAFEGECPRNG
jgi:eukaryotic-like serine/threonine-protein kinase